MDQSLQLGYIGIEVGNLAAWRRFATDMLGLEIGAPRADGTVPLRMDRHDHRFLLREGPADDLAFVGWEVPDHATLETMKARLVDAGVAVHAGSAAEVAARGVSAMIHFADPNGIRSEIYHGPRLGHGEFRPDKIAQGYLTGPMGMGHILIAARDAAETERFYRDTLGFRLSDYVDTEFMGRPMHAVFLHVNRRHHSLAFTEFPGPKRLHHFMLQVNAIDDVGAAFDRCQDLGIPIAMTIGRHPNDRMISFYGTTPSGFLFEIGWGATEVDDRTWKTMTHDSISEWGHRPVAPR